MRRLVGAVVSALVFLRALARARREEPEGQLACALHALSREERQRHEKGNDSRWRPLRPWRRSRRGTTRA